MGWQDAPLLDTGGGKKAAWELAPLVDEVQEAPQAPVFQQQTLPQAIGSTIQGITEPLPERGIGEKEWWTENLPQSISRLPLSIPVGMGQMAYNAAKKFTDPVYNALAGKQDLGSAAKDFFYAPMNAANETLNGLAEFTAAPFGLSQERTAKQAWSDPGASMLAVAPIANAVGKGVSAAMPKNIAEGLAKKSLRFSPTVEPEVQARVAKTMLEEGATTTVKSYHEFTGKLKEAASKVWELIEPVKDQPVVVDVTGARGKAQEWAATSTEKGKNSAKIDGYFESFMEDHPTLTVAEAQKIKVNLNTDLKNYYEAMAKGNRTKVNPVIKAKEQLMHVLRDRINEAAPGTAEINTRLSNLIVTKPFLKVAMNKSASRALLGSSDYHAGVIGGSIGGAMDGYVGAGTGATSAMIASRVLTDQRLQSGAAKAIKAISDIPGRIRKYISEKEAAGIVAEIGPQIQQQLQLPAPERGFSMRNPEDVYSPYSAQSAFSPEFAGEVNQLAGQRALPFENRLGLPAPESFRPNTSFDQLFQIAQSPEGKRLLLERLGREEKYSKILAELLAVPDNLIEYKPTPEMNQTRTWVNGQLEPNKVQEFQVQPSGHVRKLNALGQ